MGGCADGGRREGEVDGEKERGGVWHKVGDVGQGFDGQPQPIELVVNPACQPPPIHASRLPFERWDRP